MTYDELQSKSIDFLRFPLIVGVVFIHAYSATVKLQGVDLGTEAYLPVYNTVSEFCSQVVARIAVPLFFFISGFLFFYHTEWTVGSYKYKLNRRVKTLLIPYLFWNFSVLILFFIAQSLPGISGLFSGMNKLIGDYDFMDFLGAFWGMGKDGMPIVYPFWFIRDLMVVVLFSPAVYTFVQYGKKYGVMLLGIMWYFGWWSDIAGFGAVSFFFFTAGAYFSINKLNIILIFRKLFVLSLVIYPLLALADLLTKTYEFNHYIHDLGIVVGIVFLFNLVSHYLEKGKIAAISFLTSATFFVFACHEPWLTLIRKTLFKILKPETDALMTVLYFLAPALIIAVTLSVYALLKRYFPRFTQIITGGR